MLTHEQRHIVLISTTPEPTGHERLVLAYQHGTDLYIPLDEDRPANEPLLRASELYVRTACNHDSYDVYAVEDHHLASPADRALFERNANAPISSTTEVLHIRATSIGVGELPTEPPGFVAVLDGSERALHALAPARALAKWYGRHCKIVEVNAGADDRDTPIAVALQLHNSGVSTQDLEDHHDLVEVAARDIDTALFVWMRRGDIIVASAFGVWERDGRIHGMLNRLVRRNAPAIIGIGPNVPSDWTPNSDGPIIVCVDATEHAHHIVDKLEPFLYPSRGRVVVAHFDPDSPADAAMAQTVARAINQRYGIPVKALSQHDVSAAAGIAILASREQAQLVITHSWHRPTAGEPSVSSTSLSAVAHAPCPVVILGE